MRIALLAVSCTLIASAQQPGPKDMPQQMVWLDRSGDVLGTVGAVQNSIFFPEISPDGKFIALSSRDGEVNDRDVWIHDIAAGTKRRITKVKGNDNFPLWMPDGRSIIFTSSRVPKYDLFRVSVEPLKPPVRILEAAGVSEYPRDISRDGKVLIFTKNEPAGRTLWKLALDQDGVTPEPFIPLRSGVWADGGKFSPNGKYFAYSSNEGGMWEVYVCETAHPTKKWKVSAELRSGWAGGGGQPRWRADGKELYYIMGQDTLAYLPVETEGEFTFGEAKKLFSYSSMRGNFQDEAPWLHKYDVADDGKKFLFVRLTKR